MRLTCLRPTDPVSRSTWRCMSEANYLGPDFLEDAAQVVQVVCAPELHACLDTLDRVGYASFRRCEVSSQQGMYTGIRTNPSEICAYQHHPLVRWTKIAHRWNSSCDCPVSVVSHSIITPASRLARYIFSSSSKGLLTPSDSSSNPSAAKCSCTSFNFSASVEDGSSGAGRTGGVQYRRSGSGMGVRKAVAIFASV